MKRDIISWVAVGLSIFCSVIGLSTEAAIFIAFLLYLHSNDSEIKE